MVIRSFSSALTAESLWTVRVPLHANMRKLYTQDPSTESVSIQEEAVPSNSIEP